MKNVVAPRMAQVRELRNRAGIILVKLFISVLGFLFVFAFKTRIDFITLQVQVRKFLKSNKVM